MAHKSWLANHPHMKNFAYVAVALIVVITLVFTFGRGTVKSWVEGISASYGYELVPASELINDTTQ